MTITDALWVSEKRVRRVKNDHKNDRTPERLDQRSDSAMIHPVILRSIYAALCDSKFGDSRLIEM